MALALSIIAIFIAGVGFYKAWMAERRLYRNCATMADWIRRVNGTLNNMAASQTEDGQISPDGDIGVQVNPDE